MSERHVDCGDNSCICCPPEHRKGMRTNGGCRCFRSGNFLNLSSEESRKVRRAVLYWRQRALDAERKLEGRPLRPGEVFCLSEPRFVGEMAPREELKAEEADVRAKDIGWTCEMRRGWEVKLITPEFDQKIIECADDGEKGELIHACENMTESVEGTKVLAMGIMGWVRGIVREKSELVSFWHVDAGGSIFPLELADDDRCCFVTTSQINKKCFDMDMTRDKRRRAAEVVQELIRDIRDRQALKEQWDGMGSNVKKKVRLTWERIVKRGLR